jgi:hypothetical protein
MAKEIFSMETYQQNLLTRLTVSALFIAVMAGVWDVWWHGAIGRDTFWEPPHLFLYSAIIIAIAAGVYGWYKTREKIWRRLAIILALIPLSAPFDDMWHRIFGVEDISSPLIVWSPPHLVLIGAIVTSFAGLLPLIRRDKDVTAQIFFGGLALAAILNLLLLISLPVQPTGPYELIGFGGAGIVAFLLSGSFVVASRWIPGVAGATLVAAFFLAISAIGFDHEIAPDVVIQPHDHPPAWLTIFSILTAAAVIDFTKRKSLLIGVALAAILWSGLLYGFSSMFFEPEFQYNAIDTGVAVLASLIGGVTAVFLISKLYRKEFAIQKKL